LGHNIALVNLPVALAEPGTKISLYIVGEWRDATVCALPWFDSIKNLPQTDD
jgi:glycine cleavage system aminomethyltransferase T